jgi:hypothetical protein
MPEKKVAELILQQWDGCNIAGDDWSWVVFARRRKDMTWTVGARQNYDGSSYPVRGKYRLRSARAIKEAIEALFCHEAFDESEPDWEQIIEAVRPQHPALSHQLRELVENEVCEEEAPPSSKAENQIDDLIEEFLKRSSWPPSNKSGAGGMVAAMDNHRRRRGVLQYVQQFLEAYGSLPKGVHNIDIELVDHPPESFSNSFSAAVGKGGRITLVADFPTRD